MVELARMAELMNPRAILAAGSPPVDIPTANLYAYFKKNVGITSSGGLVSQWDDQSGNGRHIVQAVGTNQPALQGDGTILFDGVDNFLRNGAVNHTPPITSYCRFKAPTWTVNDRVHAMNGSGDYSLQQLNVTPTLRMTNGGPTDLSPALALGTYGTVTCVFDGASSIIQLDTNAGVATTNNNVGADTRMTIGSTATGAANWGNIQVIAWAIYLTSHNQATRDSIATILNSL